LFILDKLLWRIFLYYFCESDGEGSENDRDHFTAGLMLNKAECGDVDDDDEGTVYKVTQVHTLVANTHPHTHTRANKTRFTHRRESDNNQDCSGRGGNKSQTLQTAA